MRNRISRKALPLQLLMVSGASAALVFLSAQDAEMQWLAGDSHIHSHWSPGYDRNTTPPEPIVGGDAIYPTPVNAERARQFGLAWMVTTDHGGPNHSKLNLERAYAELRASRNSVPEVLQFYGMELNMPAMDHHTLIIPHSEQEASMLYDIESRFDANEAWPPDPARNQESQTRAALEHMKRLPLLPLVFANHPSRSAKGLGVYGLDEPREFRNNNDLAPDVYRGMEGAPGHQAGTLAPDGKTKLALGSPAGFRGSYRNAGAHTLGGFDQMTARLGGLWDSMLGEGRRFWIVATSDSHVHYTQSPRSGSDFWPGEYQKTYVLAHRSYNGVLEGLRSGRIFAVAGDLVTGLDVTAKAATATAGIGGTLSIAKGDAVAVTIRFRDPSAKNARGEDPRVSRVDLIMGDIRGPVADRSTDRNETTRVVARFDDKQWKRQEDAYVIEMTLPRTERSAYIRVRGTNTQDLEPPMDTVGENPWSDLWFYSNPIFIEVRN
jgi:hypothetical protein